MIAPGPEINNRENDFPHDTGRSAPPHVDPLHKLICEFSEVRKFAAAYVAAELDLFRVHARRWFLYMLVGVVAAVIGLTSLITAVVFALRGLAGLVSDLFDISWLGELVMGFGVIAAICLAGWATTSGRRNASRRELLAKYERKHKADLTRRTDERTTD
jgi:hypothetical protein